MGKYLKLFDTHSAYNTYINSQDKILPNVSYCEDNNEVHYNPIYDYSQDYLTFVALEDGSFTFTPQNNNVISYSIDNGETWTTGNSVNVTTGNKVLWKGVMTPSSHSGIGNFTSTATVNVKGNIMSLLYGDNFKNQTTIEENYVFFNLFYNYANNQICKVVNANELILPATTLASFCYSGMFSGCTTLITVPELPATTLASFCYSGMFGMCTSLTSGPELPATTLANSCYSNMFYGCTSLVTAPELPATTLANSCYDSMFINCTALITAPELPATTLAIGCYQYMFKGCTALITAPELPATTLADNCYQNMFEGCTSLVTAPELPATTLANYCYWFMFNGCISLTTTPELPATTLTTDCYGWMFSGCTSLIIVPELPATTLVTGCYENMFKGCLSLNYIKAMFTTKPGPSYTSNWVEGVAATGTFVKNSSATWTTTGNNGVPSGWTVQTASE